VAELATFLDDHAISGAPVVDAEGALLGVVSVTDIARRGAVGDGGGGRATRLLSQSARAAQHA
jgi:CBS domain-containing protein